MPHIPAHLVEEFTAQRARMRELIASIEDGADEILMDGEVILSGEQAEAILNPFIDLARLNLYLMDLLIKGQFH